MIKKQILVRLVGTKLKGKKRLIGKNESIKINNIYITFPKLNPFYRMAIPTSFMAGYGFATSIFLMNNPYIIRNNASDYDI